MQAGICSFAQPSVIAHYTTYPAAIEEDVVHCTNKCCSKDAVGSSYMYMYHVLFGFFRSGEITALGGQSDESQAQLSWGDIQHA